jgi:hypothetical protein
MLPSLLLPLCLGAALSPLSTDADRREMVARASPEELAAFLRSTPPEVLLGVSERAIGALGTYSYLMSKTERVRGILLPPQVVRVTAREQPFAVRLEFLEGPSAGRLVIFNTAVSEQRFRVHEGGFLAFAGPLWMPVDSLFARGDSNHTIRDAGLGNLVHRLLGEVRKAAALGGSEVKNEGWNGRGQFCQLHVMPNHGAGFDSASSRVCMDLRIGLPVAVESYDAAGTLLEQYAFSEVRAVKVPEASFDPNLAP